MFDRLGVYTGFVDIEDVYAPIPARSTMIAPTEIAAGKVAIFTGSGWVESDLPEVFPQAVTVPSSITMRQARLQLHAIGKLAAVQEAINQLPEPPKTEAQIEWDYAAVVERASPFVALLTPALGLSDEDMDDLFREAAKL
jgi:hypothetical protein